MSEHNNGNPPEEARLLLPWYITGKLQEAERLMVEQALTDYPELQAEYERERRLVDMIRSNASLLELQAVDGTGQRLEKMMQRIQQDSAAASPQPPPPPTPAKNFNLRDWLRNLAPSASWLTPANAVFATLLIIQAGFIGWMLQDRPAGKGEFFTVTEIESSATKPVAKGMVLLIDFNDEARIGEVRRFLHQWNARILEGPDENNLFKIEVRDTLPGSAESGSIIQEMQQNQTVVNFLGQEF